MEENPCNCSLDSYDQDIFASCNSKDYNYCSFDYEQKFELNVNNLCNDYCPLECDSFVYEINHFSQNILTSGPINGDFFHTEFNTFENVSKSFLGIYVYLEDLKYTLISQQPKFQIFDLISNIGGLFGLFLGMGLLSFAELFEIIIEAFVYFVNKLLKK